MTVKLFEDRENIHIYHHEPTYRIECLAKIPVRCVCTASTSELLLMQKIDER